MVTPTCHPERKHHARGLCSSCHRRSLEKAKIDAVRAQEQATADRRVLDTREALTKYVFPERDPYMERNYVLLGSKPEQPSYVIAMPNHGPDLITTSYQWSYLYQERVVFRPIRKCWEHKGLVVEWYDWEPRV